MTNDSRGGQASVAVRYGINLRVQQLDSAVLWLDETDRLLEMGFKEEVR